LLGRRRFVVEEDFSILETKEECFMACLSRFEEEKCEGRDVAVAVDVETGSLGEVLGLDSFARIEVRFLPVVGACQFLGYCCQN
jgi:hypothetical protein